LEEILGLLDPIRVRILKLLRDDSNRLSRIVCKTVGERISSVVRYLQTLCIFQMFINLVGRARRKVVILLFIAQIISTLMNILSNLLAGRLDKFLPESALCIYVLLGFIIALLIGDLILHLRKVLDTYGSLRLGWAKVSHMM